MQEKKLLVLGGSSISKEIVIAAKSCGVRTHVTDWYDYSNSPAKQIADEWSQVDTSNMKAMSKLIKDYNIDGILTGFTDSVLPYYAKLCRLNNLPSYGTEAQFEILTDKSKYKSYCEQYDIPITEELSIEKFEKNELGKEDYPLLIKPVDNSGARGIYISENEQELISNVKKAKSYSKSNSVLIEKYYRGDELSAFIFIKNGEVKLLNVADRYVQHVNEDGIRLPVGYVFPSKYYKKYMEEVFPKVKNFLEGLDIANGIVFIQSIVDNDKIRLYDLGFRLTGSMEYKLFNKQFAFNPLEELITFSLNGRGTEIDIESKLNSPVYPYSANITYLSATGEIDKYVGIEELKNLNNVVDVTTNYHDKSIIPEEAKGTLKQICARVFIVSKTQKELAETVLNCNNIFDVIDKEGNSKLLGKFQIKWE
ncbi:ATP-grasp domain-containing protein [Salinicoccus roseus]|uniref:ATP-grasp domain-containing protein n=1 Tax=Salinicoccus roseus TaxID=45670 RepID=UPI001EF639B9|nr:ATP-grasp domain-containing protein [Salinicoccus roseus]MCG7333057.1 ATP-grasp domain-containing protein [Salinicoccus roseus]